MSTQDKRAVVGIVAQDKDAGSRTILVHLPDTSPFFSGELKANAQKANIELKDKHQGSVSGEVTETNVIRAVFKGNELSDMPPDIVKGEQVEVYQDTDTGTFYWSASGRTTNKRSRERKELRAANVEGYSKNVDDGNSYFIKIDTLTSKEIRLQTSTSDGEQFAYTIVISPSTNSIKICDNENNEIGINSKDQHVYLRNKENCLVNISKKDVLIGAVEKLILKADQQIVFDTPVMTNANEKNDGCTVFNCKGMQINTSQSFKIKSPSIGLEGAVQSDTIVAGPIQSTGYSVGEY